MGDDWREELGRAMDQLRAAGDSHWRQGRRLSILVGVGSVVAVMGLSSLWRRRSVGELQRWASGPISFSCQVTEVFADGSVALVQMPLFRRMFSSMYASSGSAATVYARLFAVDTSSASAQRRLRKVFSHALSLAECRVIGIDGEQLVVQLRRRRWFGLRTDVGMELVRGRIAQPACERAWEEIESGQVVLLGNDSLGGVSAERSEETRKSQFPKSSEFLRRYCDEVTEAARPSAWSIWRR
jgi:hypothetical protein